MRCFDKARTDRVAANAPVAKLYRNGAGKHVTRAFGGIIQNLHRRRIHRRNRRRAHNRPAARPNHPRQNGARHQIHAFDIHIEQKVPIRFFGVQKRFDHNSAGMIEQHGHHAKRRRHLCNRRVNLGFHRYICRSEHHPMTCRRQRRRQRLTPQDIPVYHPHSGTLCREQPDRSRPAAPRPARHNRHFSLEPVHLAPLVFRHPKTVCL